MPPQISDAESGSDVEEEVIVKKEVKQGPKGRRNIEQEPETEEDQESLRVESDEDEEIAEDEYVVEKILSHAIDEETGELKFKVKWEGYTESDADTTWEPEDNLETAHIILNDYLSSVGGKDFLMAQYEEKKAAAAEKKAQGKKRGRPSTGAATQTNGKKSKRNSTHPESQTPPAELKERKFQPPGGSWEDQVVSIEAMEGDNDKVVVYLTWVGGHKTQHALHQVYKRCPQKMLKFYESHLVFKKSTNTDANSEATPTDADE